MASPVFTHAVSSPPGLAPPPPARTLVDVLSTTVSRHPNALALDDGTATLTYRALADRVEHEARGLRSHGIGPGDRVGISLPSGQVELYLAILSVLAAGAAYVPADFDEPAERAELVFREAGVCAVFGQALQLRPDLAEPHHIRRPVTPGDDAWVIFTSGSTGTPKGVAVTHRSAAAFVDAEAGLFLGGDRPIGPGDRVLAGLSVGFDASCEEMWLAWRHGGCLVAAPRAIVRSGPDLGPWLEQHGVTVVSTVPSLAALWSPEALAGVRLLIFGGEACPAELVARVDDGCREVWNTYGPTEATVVSTATRLRAGEPVRIGTPLPGWQVSVVDTAGNPVPLGETGELVIGGVGLARYLDREKDAGAYPPMPGLGWIRGYRSGDLVRAEPDGLVFVGRADHQVKIGGRRIELGEVESALLTLPGVSAAAAVVHNGLVLAGYLLVDGPLDHDDARARLTRLLPHGLVPTLVVLPDFPLTPAGKVDRKALPWPPPAAADEPAADVAPALRADVDWIGERWRELFGRTPAPTTDFFAEGGTSLAAAQLVSLLRNRFPTASITDVYHHPTPLAMAEHLTGGESTMAAETPPGHPLPRSAAFRQSLISLALLWIPGIRWTIGMLCGTAVFDTVTGEVHLPWWSWAALAGGVLVTTASPGRVLLAGLSARVLLAKVRPGAHRKGGSVHLRLWTAERLVASIGVSGLPGTGWNLRYARLLGNSVGRDVDLHSLPPVTGFGSFGDGCAVEPGADLSGWWVDGDTVHIGSVEVGANASVGGRATLLPGAVVEPGGEVAPGRSVSGTVAGTTDTPEPAARPARWRIAYAITPVLSGLLALLVFLPSAVAYTWLDLSSLTGLLWVIPLLRLVALLLTIGLTALLIRLAGRRLRPGVHPVYSREGWAAWFVERSMNSVRDSAFPIYASLFTGSWLRLLGARVGRRTEASTVVGLPQLMSVGSGAFLADDSHLATYRLRNGRVLLGTASVADRAFVGNSAEVASGRSVPAGALIGVLSQAPSEAGEGTSWVGRPALAIPRQATKAEAGRTYAPSRGLVLRRTLVELTRMVPLAISAALGFAVFAALVLVSQKLGIAAAFLASGAVLLGAGLTATVVSVAAKWLLNGRVRTGEHPLWSGFVWRNELVAVYHEELVMRWFGALIVGSPLFNAVLRLHGARIGRGVLCETKWLPEPDLIRLGDGAVINRGCVVQTHLFQDRVLRLGPIRLDAGSTLGPHTVTLFDTHLGPHSSIEANSLVMRGETVPAQRRFGGNPIAPRSVPLTE
ncbi:non-ribosomal peptide synthetase-like protein [Amycolatopsis sulphurea]|uniref:Non-ribosomal peptide synthetase-like protein n=1 Tax=Amycolatopsis sulphurea TaxID=76022 RepID=A0A2A9FDF4_9PSEU|nr:Pls/PosA family non-ribosomal peptide synthetase [Amycolatopsis sulphurea]PFG48435.1 non-ribosomal peptide synthetase-like protein [Amycolatopsis sulphurea]